MRSCVWNCLKQWLGFWGAVAVIGLLMVALTALTISTGGVGTVTLTAIIETAIGAAGVKIAAAGFAGIIGALVGCIPAVPVVHRSPGGEEQVFPVAAPAPQQLPHDVPGLVDDKPEKFLEQWTGLFFTAGGYSESGEYFDLHCMTPTLVMAKRSRLKIWIFVRCPGEPEMQPGRSA